ncbi:hypothetical protein [Microbacterium sp. 77mftsu3.1]|uniref:hypothetical protein n=1 Tax=Microbacterium sp. 77mftsu3.1 TaxID=1761802 RepID=UPI000362CEB7|nr:hypothetical protein [Microbacterium sp. 77mftsu3.1]SDH42226.1 hypothetical protein SAMN04488590_3301 [Microbacterium sp. 77mftsu3.1]
MSPATPTLADLPVPVPAGITLTELLDAVQDWRGRPLRLREVPEFAEDGTVNGVWLATQSEDLILYAPTASRLHQEQFILHEVAHMLLDHGHLDAGVVTMDLPGDLPDDIDTALARGCIGDEREIHAEAVADLLATRIRARRRSRFAEILG